MIYRRYAVPVLLVSLLLGACGGDPPEPPAPPPTQDDTPAQPSQPEDTGPTAAELAAEREAAIAAIVGNIEESVFFDYDESLITAAGERILREKANILRDNAPVQIRIEGHADERGSTEYNLALGTRRAEEVRQFLVGFGLDGGRFSIQSFGEERPLQQGSNEGAWARNRRAEFVITAGRNQITPGMADRDDR